MVWDPYAAGHRVYRGYSPNPTSGPVDPSGYVQREIDKRRTNLATDALMRRVGSPTSPTSPVRQAMSGVPTTTRQPMGAPAGTPTTPVASAPPKITTTNEGKLIADLNALPFNPQIDALRRALERQKVTALADYNRLGSQLGQEYNISRKRLGDEDILQKEALRGNFGGRGMIFSGGYAKGLSEQTRDIQNQRQDLHRLLTTGQGEISADRASFMNDYLAQLENLLTQAARLGTNRGI